MNPLAITDYSSAPYPLPFTSAFDGRVYAVPDGLNIYYNPYVAKLINTVPNYNASNVYSYWTTGTNTNDAKQYGSQSCNYLKQDIIDAADPTILYYTFVTMTAISRTVQQLGAGGLPATTSNYSYKMYFPPETTDLLYGTQLDVNSGCLSVTSLPKLTTEQSFVDAFYLVCDGTC